VWWRSVVFRSAAVRVYPVAPRFGLPRVSPEADHGAIPESFVSRILGTPNESVWPGISTLPLYQASNFPHWPSQNLQTLLPNICPEGTQALASLQRLEEIYYYFIFLCRDAFFPLVGP